jgi:hypothetical protein
MSQEQKPAYVVDLEAAYGELSQEGFGSAVFFKKVKSPEQLERVAQEQYEYFVGEKWQEWGPETWMGPWEAVYERPEGADADIVEELSAIEGFGAKTSVDMMLNNIENADEARAALAAAYDDDSVSELAVYEIGDGEAMSGLLVAGRREKGESTFLVFLMD